MIFSENRFPLFRIMLWGVPHQRSRVVARARDGGPGRGKVLRIGVTEAAVATQGGLALLNGGEPTILAAEAGVIRAPRVILRLRARADPGGHSENCQQEEQGSHGRSPGVAMPLNH